MLQYRHMMFNSGTESLVQDIYFRTDTNSTSYPIADLTRNVNRWAYKVQLAMIEGNHRWQVDDSNLTTLPHFTTTLVAGQGDYKMDAGFLRIERVEVKNASGDYEVLKQIDHRDIKEGYTEFEETDGMPKYYDLVGDSIILMPAPAAADVTTSEGLRVHVLREIDIFTTSDDTQELGFPENFHTIVTFGAASDYLVARGDYDKARAYREDAEAMLEQLRNFSSSRGDEHIRIRPSHRTVNYL